MLGERFFLFFFAFEVKNRHKTSYDKAVEDGCVLRLSENTLRQAMLFDLTEEAFEIQTDTTEVTCPGCTAAGISPSSPRDPHVEDTVVEDGWMGITAYDSGLQFH
ncbi:hypothetical protein JOB18_002699 [Solea senegalensis]|uniref:Uncharacterized protein n=1 Tax=Solea senegalensis TaxID=28829 RepID=A0AAV6T2Q0_SOLSE|nr:hypothetical protein JOB18_002699 [Solea senegalensis]